MLKPQTLFTKGNIYYIGIYICIYIGVCVCVRVCVYSNMCMCVYTCVCVCLREVMHRSCTLSHKHALDLVQDGIAIAKRDTLPLTCPQ
jgi:hypothetical protein